MKDLPHSFKFLVNGNHECNAEWKSSLSGWARTMGVQFMRQRASVAVDDAHADELVQHVGEHSDEVEADCADPTSTSTSERESLYLFGTEFSWPTVMAGCVNPFYEEVHITLHV